jgi:hypothetical protein
MIISSGNNLTDTSRNNVLTTIKVSLIVKLAYVCSLLGKRNSQK